MAKLVHISVFNDKRGSLSVIQNECPFEMKRVFYISDVPSGENRGNHGHFKNRIFLNCIQGNCVIYFNNGKTKKSILLDDSTKALILEPEDWHTLSKFSDDCVLLAICSEKYSKDDYFFEEPKEKHD